MFLMMLCMIVVSCEESVMVEPNLPVIVPEVPKFTVTVNCLDPNITVNQTGKLSVPKGTTVKIVAIPKVGYDALVSIDGSSFSSIKDTVKLVINSDYSLEFKSQEIPIIVIKPTRIDTLCAGAWKLEKSRSQKIDGSGTWENVILHPDLLTSLLSLYPNGSYQFSKGGNGLWSLSPDLKKITIGGLEFAIVKLTNNEMILVCKTPFYTDEKDKDGKYILKGYVDTEDTYIR